MVGSLSKNLLMGLLTLAALAVAPGCTPGALLSKELPCLGNGVNQNLRRDVNGTRPPEKSILAICVHVNVAQGADGSSAVSQPLRGCAENRR